jgi:hypothetical protein
VELPSLVMGNLTSSENLGFIVIFKFVTRVVARTVLPIFVSMLSSAPTS